MIRLRINRKNYELDLAPEYPLLWALRDHLALTATKYSCGKGLCGACTVHVEGKALRACITPISAVEGKAITTLEGLARGEALHPVQQAWLDHDVPQCGYCQSGQIMQAAALLAENPHPSETEVIEAMKGNLCRCGTYQRIRMAIHHAAQQMAEHPPKL